MRIAKIISTPILSVLIPFNSLSGLLYSPDVDYSNDTDVSSSETVLVSSDPTTPTKNATTTVTPPTVPDPHDPDSPQIRIDSRA